MTMYHPADDYFLRALRDLYQREHPVGLTPIEKEALKPLRARYQWRYDTKPVTLNFGYGEAPLTVDLALGYFERLADEELG